MLVFLPVRIKIHGGNSVYSSIHWYQVPGTWYLQVAVILLKLTFNLG